MTIMTATEFARNIKKALDRLEFGREEIILVRNNRQIARIIPGSSHQTALEAMADLHRKLPREAAEGWLEESRTGGTLADEVRDPWDS